ncbi:MAG: DegT/DnrJ/EryC1/StrS family aminotransferase [Alphaproteobacteria bacterium]|nr:DegT/DnrJ/EryC1/StrS family aminotransferase [Alphaproteobacteria bacterium]
MTASQDLRFLPFALPHIEEEEIEAVAEVMRRGWLTTGDRTLAFEKAFAERVGAAHAIAVNSCTAAMHLALEALGLRPGERVVVPIWTFTASAEVVRYLGADPVFVDVDPRSLCLDVKRFAETVDSPRTGSRVAAVVPVHLGGLACRMQPIVELCLQRDIAIVEDAAHSFPTTAVTRSVADDSVKLRLVGTIGQATAFSFYATKTITTGEGGMLTTELPAVADRVRTMRLHGISRAVWDRYTSTKPSWHYEIVAPGFKYNMTDTAAAIGLAQLGKADRFRSRRHQIATAYDRAFGDLAEVECPANAPPGETHAWHLYILRLNLETLRIDRDRFISEMAQRGIGCSVHFIPLHYMPYWRDRYGLTPAMFPVATAEFLRVVSLPIYTRMEDMDVGRVIEAVRGVCRAHRR